jgi:multiple sugar transport system substrate-binding protein
LIDAAFPELEMEFSENVPIDPAKSWQSTLMDNLEREQTDIIAVDGIEMYEALVMNGKILDLEPYTAKDQYELSGFLPAVTELLRASGNGKLYGISDRFFSQALAFNKTLFDRKNVPYPTEKLNWKDVFELAARFAVPAEGEQRQVGYFTSNNVFVSPSLYVTMIGKTNGLSLIDDEAKELRLGSAEWRDVIHLIVNAYETGALLPPVETKGITNQEVISLSESGDLFKAGRAAMTLAGVDLINKMKAKELPFEVGFVTAPIDPQMPDGTIFVRPLTIYAIDSRSRQPEEAWEVVKFIVSEQAARIAGKNTGINQMTTRTGLLDKEISGVPLEAFYRQPKIDTRSTILRTNPKLRPDFYTKLNRVIDIELIAVYRGERTTEEAIANMLREGKRLLGNP